MCTLLVVVFCFFSLFFWCDPIGIVSIRVCASASERGVSLSLPVLGIRVCPSLTRILALFFSSVFWLCFSPVSSLTPSPLPSSPLLSLSIYMVMEYMDHDLKALMAVLKQPFSQVSLSSPSNVQVLFGAVLDWCLITERILAYHNVTSLRLPSC